jgi:HEAT repeat protein
VHETWPISALIEAAFIEYQGDFDSPCPATVELHARGTREVLDAALTLCRSLDAEWRALGAHILGQLGQPDRTFPEECCDRLVSLLHDPDEDVMTAALYALGHLGNHRCDSDLLPLEKHPEPEIRRGVAFALDGTTLPEAVPVLLRLMKDSHVGPRDWATTTLAATCFDTPEVRAALLERATGDDDAMTRGEALYGLARRGDGHARPLLITELSGEEPPYRAEEAAKICLGLDEFADVTVETLLEELKADRH